MEIDFKEKITIVTVTFNSAGKIDDFSRTFSLFPNIVIVDNDSRDQTISAISKKLPQARVLSLKNIGFGPANNVGFEAAETEYVLFVNPDVKIDEKSVEELYRTIILFSQAAIVGPQVVRPNGDKTYTFRWDFKRKYKSLRYPDVVGPVSCLHVSGCCFLVRCEMFQAMGKFDDAIFMYWEEDDIGMRARKAGFEIISIPNAVAVHEGDASTPPSTALSIFKNYQSARSRIILFRKHIGSSFAFKKVFQGLLVSPLALIFYLIFFSPQNIFKWLGKYFASIEYVTGSQRIGKILRRFI
jgi:GT2 family glycosyltransferase